MSELFETTPKSLPKKKGDDYREKNQTKIRAVGGEWFINKMNENTIPIKRSRLGKTELNKGKKK